MENCLSSANCKANSSNNESSENSHETFTVPDNLLKESERPVKSEVAVLNDDFLVTLLSRNSHDDNSTIASNNDNVTKMDSDASNEAKKLDVVIDSQHFSSSGNRNASDDSEIVKESGGVLQLKTNCETKVDLDTFEKSSETASQAKSNDVTHYIDTSSTSAQNGDDDIEITFVATENSLIAQKQAASMANKDYRCESDSWSDDDDSSSSSSSDTSSDSEFLQIMVESSAPKKFPVVKTKGELGMDELPPIEDLVISVKEEEMMIVGKIHAVVDKLVVIHAIKEMKPLDLDSVLFLSHDKPLGRVFDVFGPVVEPYYCVRFNSVEDITTKGVEIGADVFFAPEKSDITTYVFVDELQKQKGSDASWKYNNEPPEEFLDFSDDEEEKAAKRKRLSKNRNRAFSKDSDVVAKRPFIAGISSPHLNHRDSVHSISQNNNVQIYSPHLPKRNPFSSMPPPSPSPSICSVMSAPVRMPNSFAPPQLPFSQCQRSFPQQHLLQRPSSPIVFTSYHQPPPVFGQVTLLSPLPTSLPSPSPLNSPFMNNVPTVIPGSHLSLTPQNYFNQQFQRNPSPLPQTHFPAGNSQVYLNQRFPSPSPISLNQRASPDPWLPNRAPHSFHVPPNHPLTVQIPNQSSPSVTMHAFQSMQPRYY